MPRTGENRPFYGVPTDELKPGTASTEELRQQYGSIVDNIPFVRKPTSAFSPRQDSLNRPLISRPRILSPQQSTRPNVGGQDQIPSANQDLTTDTKLMQPWYMDPKKMIPLYLGAVALLYFFYKKR
jgi:hypothetical protein